MIENKLTFNELNNILGPILRLETVDNILREFEYVFSEKIKSLNDTIEYTRRYHVTYRGFKVFFTGIGDLTKNSVYITIDFKITKNWKHYFKNPRKEIVADLKQICKKELDAIKFYPFESIDNTNPNSSTKSEKIIYYYDSSAFNHCFDEGIEMSPTIIATSENHKYYFVEFSFNPNCYTRLDDTTVLKENWMKYIRDIIIYTERIANAILKLSLNKNQEST